MNGEFLGKPIPQPKSPENIKKPRRNNFTWLVLLTAPLVLFFSFTISTNSFSSSTTSSQRSVLLSPVLFTNGCNTSALSSTFNTKTIFPLLPTSILSGTCSPAYWNIGIFQILAYKILTLLEWLAAAMAIIFTVYAGLLYISGFANEKNVSKAKSILTATYLGLAIVLLSRVILYGSIQLFSANQSSSTGNKTPITLPANGSSKLP